MWCTRTPLIQTPPEGCRRDPATRRKRPCLSHLSRSCEMQQSSHSSTRAVTAVTRHTLCSKSSSAEISAPTNNVHLVPAIPHRPNNPTDLHHPAAGSTFRTNGFLRRCSSCCTHRRPLLPPRALNVSVRSGLVLVYRRCGRVL